MRFARSSRRHRRPAAGSPLALFVALLACVAVTAGCSSGSGGSGGASAASASGSAAASKGSEGGSEGGGGQAPAPVGSALATGATGSTAATPSAKASPSAAPSYAYASASAEIKRRFAAASHGLDGTYRSVALKSITQGGQERGGLATYRFTSSQAKSAVFRNQVVNQLIMTVTMSKTTATAKIKGQNVVTASGFGAVVGWFSGDSAVLVVSLTDLPRAQAMASAYLAR